MTRLFTGDFSTGDFSQWESLAVDRLVGGGTVPGSIAYQYYPAQSQYQSQVISDGDAGYHARFEVRTGDIVASGERAEVFGGGRAVSDIGDTNFYAWSMKLDPTFPTNHHTLGWCSVMQFHDHPNAFAAPVISFGWDAASSSEAYEPGYFYLIQDPQSAPGTYTGATALAKISQQVGTWIDIKIQVKWEQDNTGFIRLWINGVRQTLLTGGQTFTGQTAVPSGVGPSQSVTGIRPQLGIYRESNTITQTDIAYYSGFRIADSEASL